MLSSANVAVLLAESGSFSAAAICFCVPSSISSSLRLADASSKSAKPNSCDAFSALLFFSLIKALNVVVHASCFLLCSFSRSRINAAMSCSCWSTVNDTVFCSFSSNTEPRRAVNRPCVFNSFSLSAFRRASTSPIVLPAVVVLSAAYVWSMFSTCCNCAGSKPLAKSFSISVSTSVATLSGYTCFSAAFMLLMFLVARAICFSSVSFSAVLLSACACTSCWYARSMRDDSATLFSGTGADVFFSTLVMPQLDSFLGRVRTLPDGVR